MIVADTHPGLIPFAASRTASLTALIATLRSSVRSRLGRPALAPDIRTLIRQMHAANPLWGAPRIHGELRKRGIAITQSTVATYLAPDRGTPSS